MAVQNNSLGYIIIGGAESMPRGMALVADVRGIPLECIYTEPVKLNRLQRILYGKARDTYLKEELILKSLLEAVETKPQLWLCNDAAILNPLKFNAKVKAVMLENSSHDPLEAIGHVESTQDPNVFWLQTDKAGAPLKLTFPTDTRADEMKMSVANLIEAAKTMELLEPFDRLQKAIVSLVNGVE